MEGQSGKKRLDLSGGMPVPGKKSGSAGKQELPQLKVDLDMATSDENSAKDVVPPPKEETPESPLQETPEENKKDPPEENKEVPADKEKAETVPEESSEPAGDKSEEKKGQTAGKQTSFLPEEEEGKEKESSRKNTWGEVMVLQVLNIPHPADPTGKEKMEVWMPLKNEFPGGAPEAEKFITDEMQKEDGELDSGCYVIIRRVKKLRTKVEVIRRVEIFEE